MPAPPDADRAILDTHPTDAWRDAWTEESTGSEATDDAVEAHLPAADTETAACALDTDDAIPDALAEALAPAANGAEEPASQADIADAQVEALAPGTDSADDAGTEALAPGIEDAGESAPQVEAVDATIDEDASGSDTPDRGRDDTAAPLAEADPALFDHALRIAEALVFASDRPVAPARLQTALPPGCDARAVLTALAAATADRPAPLVEVAGGFAFRTAPDLAPAITRVVEAPRRLPRAAMETLAIVAYHQPVTRAEIEEIRGASLSQSTLELLLDAALIAPRGRKEVPGRPSLWATTPRFLEQFGLKALGDLPRREELVNEPPPLPLEAPTAPHEQRQQQPPEEEAGAPLAVA
jgi:segregation and condensation protein B